MLFDSLGGHSDSGDEGSRDDVRKGAANGMTVIMEKYSVVLRSCASGMHALDLLKVCRQEAHVHCCDPLMQQHAPELQLGCHGYRLTYILLCVMDVQYHA